MRCSTASLCSTIEAGGKRSPPPGLDEVTKDHMETVTKCDYDFEKDQWNRTSMLCYIQDKPFDEGNLRRCHMMVGYEDDGLRRTYVAKEAKTDAGQDAYEKDIEMQEISQYLAKQYNQFSPPKKVEFLHAFLIQLDSRPLCPRTGKPQMRHVEPYLPGEYKKHNNNWGYVCKDRNTPQAFSHFTYHYSSRFLRHRIKSPIMVVDVQGVGDIFTDPQIHSEDGQGYGMGNCGYDGIKKFFNTHECNELCRFVGVKAHNFQANDSGTRAPQLISPRLKSSESFGSPSLRQVLSRREKTQHSEHLGLDSSDEIELPQSAEQDATEQQYQFVFDMFHKLASGRTEGNVNKDALWQEVQVTKEYMRLSFNQKRYLCRFILRHKEKDLKFEEVLQWWAEAKNI
jgi:hypothetical protein